ncbi:hypothetical protein GCM10007049_00360 [Echinicola pacifica]|uniref:Outer membrane protein beta-barrel domain-containing protein n=1 Tax=Echinicola pacifica TaxID=346377 RepID=A0A918PL41_9BACT|nr:hypothetical protein [Echinicola pacifica]GGZ12600.1 hypothetical protein GCM10007049_00360 [Echinicola pacifica]
MNQIKKILFLVGLAFWLNGSASGQDGFTISYPVAFATGDIADYVKPVSFRGLTFDYRSRINENIALGLSSGWNVFYEELPYDTYTIGNESISGKQYRYNNQIPILFTAAYYLKPDQKFNPYGSLGIGTTYSRRNTDMGLYTVELEAWNFTLAPEVGVQSEVIPGLNTSFSLIYYNGFQAGNELDKAQSYLAIKIGVEL